MSRPLFDSHPSIARLARNVSFVDWKYIILSKNLPDELKSRLVIYIDTVKRLVFVSIANSTSGDSMHQFAMDNWPILSTWKGEFDKIGGGCLKDVHKHLHKFSLDACNPALAYTRACTDADLPNRLDQRDISSSFSRGNQRVLTVDKFRALSKLVQSLQSLQSPECKIRLCALDPETGTVMLKECIQTSLFHDADLLAVDLTIVLTPEQTLQYVTIECESRADNVTWETFPNAYHPILHASIVVSAVPSKAQKSALVREWKKSFGEFKLKPSNILDMVKLICSV